MFSKEIFSAFLPLHVWRKYNIWSILVTFNIFRVIYIQKKDWLKWSSQGHKLGSFLNSWSEISIIKAISVVFNCLQLLKNETFRDDSTKYQRIELKILTRLHVSDLNGPDEQDLSFFFEFWRVGQEKKSQMTLRNDLKIFDKKILW